MRKGKALNFERLENRRLLAADLGYDVMGDCIEPPTVEACMIAPEIVESSELDVSVDPIAPGQEDSLAVDHDDTASEQPNVEPGLTLDLSDGMDGYFGSIDAESPASALSFQSDSNGMVDVVVASSFGENSTNLEIVDADGNFVAASMTEGLEGFGTLSFEADAGQTYELTVSSEDGGTGNFQVTLGMSADAELVETTDEEGGTQVDEEVLDDLVSNEANELVDEDLEDSVLDDFEDSQPEIDALAGDSELPAIEPIVGENELEIEAEDESSESGDILDADLQVGDETTDSASQAENESEGETDGELVEEVEPPVDEGAVDEEQVDEETVDEQPGEDCLNPEDIDTDLHSGELGPDATIIDIVDRFGDVAGDLESSDDVDAFRFTSPATGQVSLIAGEVSAENVDLDIQIFNGDGNLIVDGATNDSVSIQFDAQQDSEYFVLVNSSEDQNGSYELKIEVAENGIFDDHADETGDQATEISAVGEVVTGVLELADDADAFQYTATQDGEVVLNLQANSEGHASDARVQVFRDGEMVAEGMANESVGLRFVAAANSQYQFLVDSANQTVMNYQLTATEYPELANPIEDLVVEESSQEILDDDSAIEEPIVCTFENDGGIEEVADEVFAELGETEAAGLLIDDFAGNEESSSVIDPEFQWAFSFDGSRFYSRFNGV